MVLLPLRKTLASAAPMAALLLGSLAFVAPVTAQLNLSLRDLPAGRGEVILGEGGLTGSPATGVVGRLGATAAWVDLDGDGFEDYVFGAPLQPANPLTGTINDAGHVYVIFGSADTGSPGSEPDLDLVTLAVGQGLDLRGRVDDLAGSSLAAAGDVDGDGFDDLFIGAPGFNQPGRPGSGCAYVLWGNPDWKTMPVDQSLNSLFMIGRATRFVGAHLFGEAGTAVGGNVDVDGDGRPDLVMGAPLASTTGRTQNGTASIVYGDASYNGVAGGVVDLAALGAGEITVVHGAMDFQFLGSAVAGLGRFDPVLPGTGGMLDLVNGDEVVLGAPGTLLRGGLFTGAAYVLRGQPSGPLAASLTTADFTGGDSAGHAYLGAATGDQAGAMVRSAGDLFGSDGFVELVIGAPFDDGPGRPDTGVLYIAPGRLAGVNPVGFDLGTVGPGDGLSAVRIFGAATQDGTRGVYASAAGDLDGDAVQDLAIGFPAASALDNGTAIPAGGYVSILGGATLNPVSRHTVDMAADLTGIELIRLHGEAAGAHGGSSLAVGDANGDGNMDVLIGAAGAPSDPSFSDPTGQAFLNTGRGQVLFGPLTSINGITPTSSWFEGPSVFVEMSGSTTGITITLDGVPATILGVTGAGPFMVEVAVPQPLAPGAGATVDLGLVTPGGLTLLENAFTYVPFAIDTGPLPTLVMPGVEMAFTGSAISSPADMFVTVGGVGATVSVSDPVAGTMSVTAPAGVPSGMPLNVEFTTSNGGELLMGVVTYDDFIVASVVPNTGPQYAGINVPGSTPGFSYFGEPDYPVEVTLVTSTGMAPPETVVEFGTDALGYQVAEITGTVGDVVTVNLPYNLMGPVAVPVDVRVTTDEGVQTVAGGFTYDPSDFETIRSTENAAYGGIPELLAAGDYKPGGKALILMRGWPTEAQFAVGFMGLDVFDPLFPFVGGLLGPMPTLVINVSVVGLEDAAIQLNHSPMLGPIGLEVWTQIIVQENDGMADDWSHSAMLKFTVSPP